MEAACGMTVGEPLRALRRLLYCGEWIESHALHVYMLHAPDFLGYESAIHMAADHLEVVKKALELKKIGNDLVALVGGREIHPINVRVGGFYRVPTRRELAPIAERLKRALDLSLEAVRFASSLEFPAFEQDSTCARPRQYPLNEAASCLGANPCRIEACRGASPIERPPFGPGEGLTGCSQLQLNFTASVAHEAARGRGRLSATPSRASACVFRRPLRGGDHRVGSPDRPAVDVPPEGTSRAWRPRGMLTTATP
jgi:hypothetical protein